MDDLISRQAAIDTLNVDAELLRRVLDNTDLVGAEREKFEWGLWLIESHIYDMEELPPAQPEPITVNIDHELTQDDYEKLRKDMANVPIMLLPSAQQWIPCSERLPENEDIYLVTLDKSNLLDNETQVTDTYWINNQWQYGVLESYEHRMPKLVIEPIEELKVIAWMPLPEPYKGEES